LAQQSTHQQPNFLRPWRWLALAAALLAAASHGERRRGRAVAHGKSDRGKRNGENGRTRGDDALATGYWLAAGAAIAIVLVTMLYAVGSGRG